MTAVCLPPAGVQHNLGRGPSAAECRGEAPPASGRTHACSWEQCHVRWTHSGRHLPSACLCYPALMLSRRALPKSRRAVNYRSPVKHLIGGRKEAQVLFEEAGWDAQVGWEECGYDPHKRPAIGSEALHQV